MTRLDSRASWEGVLGGEPVQIIAAVFRGKAVYFRIVAPWMPVEQGEAAPAPAIQRCLAYSLLQNLLLLGALLLARRNVRLGRGDRKGAPRIAAVVLIACLANWLFLARHVADAAEFDNLQAAVAQTLYGVVYVYLAYLAIGPSLRRGWPNMLVSWTRALAGRPLFGRAILED